MISALSTAREAERLALLHTLDLLDSPADETFDTLTRLVVQVLGVPIALVSLVDEHRQWFKSRQGLDATETAREVAFCAHAIGSNDVLVVPDALADPRFADNPLVTGEPKMRAYAGVPLRSREGLPLGTLCAIDHEPRQFTPAQLHILRDLAQLAEREIVHREAVYQARQVAQDNERIVGASEALFRGTFEQAAIGMAIVSTEGRWLRVNHALCALLGRSATELEALTFQQVTHPEDLELDVAHRDALLAGHGNHFTMEKRYLKPDGQTVWGNLTVTFIQPPGQCPYFVAIVENIDGRKAAEASLMAMQHELEDRVVERTKELQQTNELLVSTIQHRAQSEKALRASEEELRAVLQSALDAYLCVNEAGIIVEWNRQAEITFGWSRSEACGRRLEDLIILPALRQNHRGWMSRMIETGQGRVLGKRMELPAVTRDGRVIPCEVTINALPTNRGRIYAAFMHDISERKRAQQLRADSEHRLRMVADNIPGLVGHVDKSLRYTFANGCYQDWLSLSPESVVGKSVVEVIGPANFQLVEARMRRALGGEPSTFEQAFVVGGRPRICLVHYVPDTDAQGQVHGLYITALDITSRHEAEQALVASEQRLRTIADNLPVLIGHVDKHERFQFCNKTYSTWLGVDAQAAVGRTVEQALGAQAYGQRKAYIERALAGERVEFEIAADEAGQQRHLQLVYLPDRGMDGRVDGFYALVSDISAVKAAEQRLSDLALTDTLTGLDNRRSLGQKLPQALARSRRTGHPLALLFLDVDRFKSINDTLGHGIGDEVLKIFANRLKATVRQTDTVARLSGDEFVILLEGMPSSATAELVARKVIEAITVPFELPSGPVQISTSIGVACHAEGDITPEALLASADRALYAAKASGRNTWRLMSAESAAETV